MQYHHFKGFLLIMGLLASQSGLAFFGAPYRFDYRYGDNPPLPSTGQVLDYFWAQYQRDWYWAFPGCSYTLSYTANGSVTGDFVYLTLRGTCGGGGTVRGTYYARDTRKNNGVPALCVGNPCDPASGNKYQQELDFENKVIGLSFTRHYNSNVKLIAGYLGFGWSHGLESSLESLGNQIIYHQADGRAEWFVFSNGLWQGDADSLLRLTQDASGYTLTNQLGAVERYNAAGRIVSRTEANGRTTSYSYDSSQRLASVAGPFGHSLQLAYDNTNRISSVTYPDGLSSQYQYDSEGNLSKVTYQDGSFKLYHYESTAFPHALTGITDENGNRYATWSYDSQGRANLSKHADGVEQVALTYNSDGSTDVVDSFNTSRHYTFQTILNVQKLTSISQPAGAGSVAATRTQSYDANGNLASHTDFNGNLSCYAYDLTRNLETTRIEGLASGSSCPANLSTYTPAPNSIERKISSQWHASYRLPTQIDQAGQRINLTYDAAGNLLNKTILDTASQQSRTWTYTYNNLGQILTANGPRTDVSDVTTYTYYADSTASHKPGDLWKITNALGHVTTFNSYDANGRPLSISDPNGLLISLSYDVRARLTQKTVDGNSTQYSYDAVGNLTKLTRPSGVFYRFNYDAAHRLTDITDALGGKIHYTLDAMGNRIKEDILDSSGAVVKTHSRVHDALNRLAQDIGAYNQTIHYQYDANGNLTQVTDANGHASRHQYDSLDRVIRSTDALAGLTDYYYDGQDRLTQVTDANNHSTQYSYNGLGDLLQLDSPNTGITQYAYDSAGNLSQKTDARGIVAAYQHDALNRITLVDYPDDTLDIHYSYDSHNAGQNGIGRLVSVSDGTGETHYTFDLRGNLLTHKTVLDAKNYLTRYAYNSDNSITQAYYPSGRQIDFHYDLSGQVDALTTQQGETNQILADTIRYLPFGSTKSLSLGNGLLETQQHDRDYRPVERGLGILANHGYFYDPTGNIAAITDLNNAANDKSFTYDALSRLTTAQDTHHQLTYSLDATGNRQALATNAHVDDYVYALGSDRLLSVASKQFGYDENGHVIADNRYQYRYGDHNRLTTVLGAGATLAEYAYNALGQRVKKATSAALTHYHYNQDGQLIAETSANGNTQKEYLYLNDRLIALAMSAADQDQDGVIDRQDNCRLFSNPDQRDTDSDGFGNWCDADFNNNGIVDPADFSLLKSRLGTSDPNLDINGNGIIDPADLSRAKSLIGQPPGPGADPNAAANARIYFAHTDHLGTPTILTDSNQNIAWQAKFDPFGKATVSAETVTNNIRFPGQYFDAETSLHYNMQRYYEPSLGRYLQSDPIGLAGGINTYAYAYNNPVNLIDPDGRSPLLILRGLRLLGAFLPMIDLSMMAVDDVPGGGIGKSCSVANKLTSNVDNVIAETLAGKGNITSSVKLSTDELLNAGEQFLGNGYKEIGKSGSGVFRSADDLRQFRIDDNSLLGNHAPGVPHGHLETYAPGATKPTVNNHIPFID